MRSTDQQRSEARRFFGDRLRQARKAAGLTQEALGAMIGLAQPEISSIERAGRTMPADLISAAASACSVDAGYFFADGEVSATPPSA